MAKAKRYGKVKRTIVVGLSDTHAGCIFGLMNPEVVLLQDDPETKSQRPWTPSPTASQEYVWKCHEADRQTVLDLASGDDILLYHMGDLTHGNHWMRELVSTRPADQFSIAAENLRPWLRSPNVRLARLIKGTAVHEFGEGSGAMAVADKLAGEFRADVQAVYHTLTDIRGVSFDLAHHGAPPGIRNWLKGNVLDWYVRSMMMDELQEGNDPAQVVWRGHFHNYVSRIVSLEARARTWETWACILPAYCLLDDHARKVARSPAAVTIGLVAAEVVDGQLAGRHAFRRKIDMRTRETIQ